MSVCSFSLEFWSDGDCEADDESEEVLWVVDGWLCPLPSEGLVRLRRFRGILGGPVGWDVLSIRKAMV